MRQIADLEAEIAKERATSRSRWSVLRSRLIGDEIKDTTDDRRPGWGERRKIPIRILPRL